MNYLLVVLNNVNNWSSGWMLVPRQIPMMELTQQRLQNNKTAKKYKC